MRETQRTPGKQVATPPRLPRSPRVPPAPALPPAPAAALSPVASAVAEFARAPGTTRASDVLSTAPRPGEGASLPAGAARYVIATGGYSAAVDLNYYRMMLEAGAPLPDGVTPHVAVRILKSKDGTFKKTSDDANRLFTLCAGASDAREYPGKTGVQLLKRVGYSDALIRGRASEYTFQLVAFAADGPGALKAASWENVFGAIERLYPPAIWQRVATHAAALSQLRAEDIGTIESMACRQYGVKAFNIENPGREPMTPAALAAIDEPTLVDVRRFLNDTLSLNRLYAGDGYTREEQPDGSLKKGVVELILPAGNVEDIGPHVRFDLTLDLSELPPPA